MTSGKGPQWLLVLLVIGIVVVTLWNTLKPPDHWQSSQGEEFPLPGPAPTPASVPPAVRIVDGKEVVAPHSDPKNPVPPPLYPMGAKRNQEEGTVVLLLTIDAQGRVIESQVDKTSGYDRLDEAAMSGSKTWKLIPGTVDGKPTAMKYKFAVTFKIND
jgi:periplasmic protein TonB